MFEKSDERNREESKSGSATSKVERIQREYGELYGNPIGRGAVGWHSSGGRMMMEGAGARSNGVCDGSRKSCCAQAIALTLGVERYLRGRVGRGNLWLMEAQLIHSKNQVPEKCRAITSNDT